MVEMTSGLPTTAAEGASPAARRATFAGHSWLLVMFLVGVDYFSTLAYQPGMSFGSAGPIAPIATLVVAAVTLFGAAPLYAFIAGRSSEGEGAVALIERHLPGWRGKLLVVISLGFVSADFVMTRSIAAADAAVHILHSERWQPTLQRWAGELRDARARAPAFAQRPLDRLDEQMVIAAFVSVLAFMFWWLFRRGFTARVLWMSAMVAAIYLAMSAFIIGAGLWGLARNPDRLIAWWQSLFEGQLIGKPPLQEISTLIVPSLTWFPTMALGLSGFELVMVVMPLIGGNGKDAAASHRWRVSQTRRLLTFLAVIMSIHLLAATLVVTLYLPPQAVREGGPATGRALAYLAHGGRLSNIGADLELSPWFGPVFGGAYDVVTVALLCLAGASVTVGLRDLVPSYLLRLGMELEWAHNVGAMLYLFGGVSLGATLLFRANVEAQRGAYATSVLILIAIASLSAVLAVRNEEAQRGPRIVRMSIFGVVGVGFVAAALTNILHQPSGLYIALSFVVVIVIMSMLSRWLRSTELRVIGFEFVDTASKGLWTEMKANPMPILVPHRPGQHTLDDKETEIRRRHRIGLETPIVFVIVEVSDPSNFYQQPLLELSRNDGRYVINVTRAASISHVLAAIGLELAAHGHRPELHFGWSEESPLAANLNFLLFGEGNIPWMVRSLVGVAQSDPLKRPEIIVG